MGIVRRAAFVCVLVAAAAMPAAPAAADTGEVVAAPSLRALAGRISAGGNHTCAVRNDARVSCWGNNIVGQLGVGDLMHRGDQPGELPAPAVPMQAGRSPVAVASGDYHACVVLDDGAVTCWGYNNSGQLGLGDVRSRGDEPGELPEDRVPLPYGRRATAVSAGIYHSCALLDNGRVHCWGYNAFGQLGVGDTLNRGDAPGELPAPPVPLGTGRRATAIAAGSYHTCALLDDGSVACWGYNGSGRLGVGDTLDRGDQPDEMPPPAVALGAGRTAKAVTAGDSHSCAILDDGSVMCWGHNGYGQLGVGDVNARGDAPGELPSPLVGLGGGRTAVAAGAGDYHTCALRDDRSVVCWGYNFYGQLGVGATDYRGDQPGELPAPAVPLGAGRVGRGLAVGAYHACALLDDGSVRCWGYNAYGQLGVGATDNRGDAPGELPAPVVPLGGVVTMPAFAVSNAAVNEGTGGASSLSFVVSRTSVVGEFSVAFATTNGTAVAPGDYAATSGRVVLPAGVRSVRVEVPVVTDSTYEPTETMTLNLSAPSGGATIADGSGIGTIRNDDARPVVTIKDATITEPDSGTANVTVRVVLDHRSYQQITVRYATADASAVAPGDYASKTGTVTIPAGALSVGVPIAVVGDTVREPSETFYVGGQSVTNATFDDPAGAVVIFNDD